MKFLPVRHTRNPLKSMSYRLPATYAVIALLVVLVLGLVLYLTLRLYYSTQERQYLEANAVSMSRVLEQILPTDNPEQLQTQVHFFSFIARTRVEILDSEGNVIASGNTFDEDPFFARGNNNSRGFFVSSDTIEGDIIFDYLLISPENRNSPVVVYDAGEIQLLPPDPQSSPESDKLYCPGWMEFSLSLNVCLFMETLITFVSNSIDNNLPADIIPLNFANGASGSDMSIIVPAFDPGASPIRRAWDRYQQNSDVVYTTGIYSDDGSHVGTLHLSDGPAYGGQIIEGVMYGWLLASAVSVGLAVVLGWIASRDVVIPLQELSQTTRQMATGDLSARAFIQREDEFGNLGDSFNYMANRIEETVNTLRHFMSDAAHEINTPITALRTNLELIRPDEGIDNVERALSQVKRLENLTKNLLHLSRLESDVDSASLEMIDAGVLMQTVAQFHASRAEQAGIALLLDLPQTALMIRANEAQIQQALTNLINNAIKFTPMDGEIRLSVQGIDNCVRFTVDDTGIGISSADLPFLFNRFHRGRNAARYEGNGLGLAIVKAIISRYGGTVSAENTAKGACFLLDLPLASDRVSR